MSADPEQIESVLVALADPTRRKLLGALADEGSASASRLAGRLPVSRQAVVKHLHLLKEAGLVSSGRSGREVLFQVETASLTASVRWMADLAATWDRRLQALKRAAELPDADT
ncbi:MAG TPA: metalloregulator ArsR/SmtB family transcription factor [Nitrolancea sp.]|jgi:DNA-binding transcriptional ArsR family regulator|nr:metalloregulator ArsR/SmtB family transcription factor [Nitrolancea sp.]